MKAAFRNLKRELAKQARPKLSDDTKAMLARLRRRPWEAETIRVTGLRLDNWPKEAPATEDA